MKRKKIAIPAAVGVAAVWFGTHAGGGFATGRQEVEFFVRFGWHAVWIGLLSMFIMGLAVYFGLEFARIHQVYDYKSWIKKLFEPFDKIPAFLWELLFLYAAILASGVAIAGSSDLVHQALHIPYELAVGIIALILLLFTIFGAGLVRNASTVMSFVIITALLVVTILGIKLGSSNLADVVQKKTTTAGVGTILWMALLYGAFPSVLIASLVSVSETLKSRKKCFQTALFGFFMNGMMLVLVCIMLLGFFPAIVKENLPVYFVATRLDQKWIFGLYSIILFFALISTGVGMIFGVVKRFEKVWAKGKGIFQSIHLRRIAISFICMLIAAGISFFGLTAIVAVGYVSLGIFSIFLNIIPLLFIAPYKIKKAGKTMKQEGG
jgi:uncharacterized membrane protein YkvI